MTEVLAKDLKAGMVIVDGDYEPVYVAYAEVDSFSEHTVYAVMDSLAVGLMHRTYAADDRLTQASADQARECFQHRQSRGRRKRLVEGLARLQALFSDQRTPLPDKLRVRVVAADDDLRYVLKNLLREHSVKLAPGETDSVVVTAVIEP